MMDYGCYTDTFRGSLIPREDWDALGLRAQALFRWLADRYTLTPLENQAETMAICALAEYLLRQEPLGLVQKTLGEVSLRYENRPGLIRGALLTIAPYFRVYRGVGA